MTLSITSQTTALSFLQSLYVSRMGTAMQSSDSAGATDPVADPVPTTATPLTSYATTTELSLELNVRLQLAESTAAEETFTPEPRPLPEGAELAPAEDAETAEEPATAHGHRGEHGRGSVEHFGRNFRHLGKALGRALHHIAQDLELDDATRAEIKDMIKDLHHDLKDAFKSVADGDGHDHREHAQRPDAATAFAAVEDALASFSARLQELVAALGGGAADEEPVVTEPVAEPQPAPLIDSGERLTEIAEA